MDDVAIAICHRCGENSNQEDRALADNVEKLYPANASDNPDNVLEQAIGQYQDVFVIGWDKDGEMDVRSSSALADGGDILWLIEKFKSNLLNGEYEG